MVVAGQVRLGEPAQGHLDGPGPGRQHGLDGGRGHRATERGQRVEHGPPVCVEPAGGLGRHHLDDVGRRPRGAQQVLRGGEPVVAQDPEERLQRLGQAERPLRDAAQHLVGGVAQADVTVLVHRPEQLLGVRRGQSLVEHDLVVAGRGGHGQLPRRLPGRQQHLDPVVRAVEQAHQRVGDPAFDDAARSGVDEVLEVVEQHQDRTLGEQRGQRVHRDVGGRRLLPRLPGRLLRPVGEQDAEVVEQGVGGDAAGQPASEVDDPGECRVDPDLAGEPAGRQPVQCTAGQRRLADTGPPDHRQHPHRRVVQEEGDPLGLAGPVLEPAQGRRRGPVDGAHRAGGRRGRGGRCVARRLGAIAQRAQLLLEVRDLLRRPLVGGGRRVPAGPHQPVLQGPHAALGGVQVTQVAAQGRHAAGEVTPEVDLLETLQEHRWGRVPVEPQRDDRLLVALGPPPLAVDERRGGHAVGGEDEQQGGAAGDRPVGLVLPGAVAQVVLVHPRVEPRRARDECIADRGGVLGPVDAGVADEVHRHG